MELLGEWVLWNLVSVRLETMLVSMQYRCMVCTKRNIGSEIILDAPIETTRLQGSEIIFDMPDGTPGEWVMWNLISVHLEIMLVLRQHRCMVCTEHTIGSGIVLDAPIGTTRRQGSGGSSFWSVWR
jgi:hypothetical protein